MAREVADALAAAAESELYLVVVLAAAAAAYSCENSPAFSAVVLNFFLDMTKATDCTNGQYDAIGSYVVFEFQRLKYVQKCQKLKKKSVNS